MCNVFLKGLVGLLSNFDASQQWCRTTLMSSQCFYKLLDMCQIADDPDTSKAGKHRELENAQMKTYEEAVQRTMSTICNFSNPFTLPDKDHLCNIASGAFVSADVDYDVLCAEACGRDAKETFIQDRLEGDYERMFLEPIKRQQLKTMEAPNKTAKLTSSQEKVRNFYVIE